MYLNSRVGVRRYFVKVRCRKWHLSVTQKGHLRYLYRTSFRNPPTAMVQPVSGGAGHNRTTDTSQYCDGTGYGALHYLFPPNGAVDPGLPRKTRSFVVRPRCCQSRRVSRCRDVARIVLLRPSGDDPFGMLRLLDIPSIVPRRP